MGIEHRRWCLLLVITGQFCYIFFRRASLGPPIKELTLPHHFPPLPPTTECVPFTPSAGGHLRLCVKPMEEDAVVSANIRFLVSQWVKVLTTLHPGGVGGAHACQGSTKLLSLLSEITETPTSH